MNLLPTNMFIKWNRNETQSEPYSSWVPHTAAEAASEKDPINSLIPFLSGVKGRECHLPPHNLFLAAGPANNVNMVTPWKGQSKEW